MSGTELTLRFGICFVALLREIYERVHGQSVVGEVIGVSSELVVEEMMENR